MVDQKDHARREPLKIPEGSGGEAWGALMTLVNGPVWANNLCWVCVVAFLFSSLLIVAIITTPPDLRSDLLTVVPVMITILSIVGVLVLLPKSRQSDQHTKRFKKALEEASINDLMHVHKFAKDRALAFYQLYLSELAAKGKGNTRIAQSALRFSEDPRVGFQRALEIQNSLDKLNLREVFAAGWQTYLMLVPMFVMVGLVVVSTENRLELFYPTFAIVLLTPLLMIAVSSQFPRKRSFSTEVLETLELVDLYVATRLAWLAAAIRSRAKAGDKVAKGYHRALRIGRLQEVRREELERHNKILWSQIVDQPPLGAIRAENEGESSQGGSGDGI